MSEAVMTNESVCPIETPLKQTWKRLKKQRFALSSLFVCMLFLAISILAEIYSIVCQRNGTEAVYEKVCHEDRNLPPSEKYWCGTDYLGRSVLVRAVFGIKTAVKVGIIASLISATIGVLLGIWAGYKGGTVDDFIVWLYSTFASMPTLLFILAFALLVSKGFLFPPLANAFSALATLLHTESGMLAVYLGIGLTGWVDLCRVVRAETMKLREMQYIQAAKTLGAGDFRIVFHHILPNLSHLVIVYFTMRFAFAVMTEVVVSYLGFGAQSDPSWGIMISEGQQDLWRGIWWEVGTATFFMFVLVLALNLLGDALRDATDPKL